MAAGGGGWRGVAGRRLLLLLIFSSIQPSSSIPRLHMRKKNHVFTIPIKVTNVVKIREPNEYLPIVVKYIDPITPAIPRNKLSNANA